jgi:hypothetical protein
MKAMRSIENHRPNNANQKNQNAPMPCYAFSQPVLFPYATELRYQMPVQVQDLSSIIYKNAMNCESGQLFLSLSLEGLEDVTGSLGRLGTLDSGRPTWEILRGRGELEGAVLEGDELAILHAARLVDIDEGVAVVEARGGTGFAVDQERVACSWGDVGLVLDQAGCERVAEVCCLLALRKSKGMSNLPLPEGPLDSGARMCGCPTSRFRPQVKMGTQEAWTMAAAARRVRAEVVNCMLAVVGFKLGKSEKRVGCWKGWKCY